MTRYFCPTCGAHVGDYDHGEWEFATGMLDSTEDRLNRVQLWIEDVKDGGAASWLSDVDGLEWTRHIRGRDSATITWEQLSKLNETSPHDEKDRLYGRCHCGDIRIFITKPAAEPPDDPDRGRWWVKGDRYTACFDPCTSCRLCTGFEIMAWAFVPMQNIFHLDGSPFSVTSKGLKTYTSSPPVRREFCGRCGATVFFRKLTRKVDIVDIAVGLFDSSSGARAEQWLAWEEYDMDDVRQDAIDQAFSQSMYKGLESWTKSQK
ncbi:MAG: hypothetical protein Q9160_004841 [Pyrenula sp. 1 TL-2023]